MATLGDQNKAAGSATQLAAAPPRTGEIATLVEELNSATLNLQDTASMLGDGLRPVLRNEPSQAKDMAEMTASTDFGQFLSMLITRVHATNNQLNDVRNRLEL